MTSSKQINVVNTVWTGVVVSVFIIILGLAIFSFGRLGISDKARLFQISGAIAGIVFSVAFVLLQAGKNELLKVGFVAEVVRETPLSGMLAFKFGLPIAFAGLVALLASGGFQIWDEPVAFDQVDAFSALDTQGFASSLYSVALVPAFVEDMASFAISVGLAILILAGVKLLRGTITPGWYYTSWLISSPIAAFFFSTAHEIVGGQNLGFFIIAWLFQTVNLYIFWVTGLFFPLAHFVHNGMFVLGFSIALSTTLVLVPLLRRKKIQGDYYGIRKSKNVFV